LQVLMKCHSLVVFVDVVSFLYDVCLCDES
jgi:hypothetical protein